MRFILQQKNWIVIMVLLGMVIVLFKTKLRMNYIPSASMEPSINSGELIIAKKYNNEELNRKTIITFTKKNENKVYVKRIIGVPGDTIAITDNAVYLNGKSERKFITPAKYISTLNKGVFIVPKDKYFVMGDNTDNSTDSRYWSEMFVNRTNIIGVAKIKLFSFNIFIK